MDVKSTWIPTWHQMDHVSWSFGLFSKSTPLESRPSTKLEDHDTPNTHNPWFILFYRVWGPTWIEFHWNSIWLRTQSHMTSHYTWGSVTTLHDFGGELGWPLDTFFWALTISWSCLLARVCTSPHYLTTVLVAVASCALFVLPAQHIVSSKSPLVLTHVHRESKETGRSLS
jgi:hypothetical protein